MLMSRMMDIMHVIRVLESRYDFKYQTKIKNLIEAGTISSIINPRGFVIHDFQAGYK